MKSTPFSQRQSRGRLFLGVSLVLCLGHVAAFAPGRGGDSYHHPRRSYYDESPSRPFLQYIPDKDDDIAFAPSHNTQAGFVLKNRSPYDHADEEEERLWRLRQEDRRNRRRRQRQSPRTDSAFDRVRREETRQHTNFSAQRQAVITDNRQYTHRNGMDNSDNERYDDRSSSPTMFSYRGEGRRDVIYEKPRQQTSSSKSSRTNIPTQVEERGSSETRSRQQHSNDVNDNRDPDWVPVSERLDNRNQQYSATSVRPSSSTKREHSPKSFSNKSSARERNNNRRSPAKNPVENNNNKKKKNDQDYKRHRHTPREKVDTWAGSRVPQKAQLPVDQDGKPRTQFTKNDTARNQDHNRKHTGMPATWAGSKVKQKSHLSLDARGKPRTQFLRGGKPDPSEGRSGSSSKNMPETWAGSKVQQGSRIESQVTVKPDESKERPLNPEEAEAERAHIRIEQNKQAAADKKAQEEDEENEDDTTDEKEPFFQQDCTEHAYFNDNHFHDKEPTRRQFRPRGAGGYFNLWTKPNPMEMKEYSAASRQRQPFLQQPNMDPSHNSGRVIREPYREELYYPDNEFDNRPQGSFRHDKDVPRSNYRRPEDSYYYSSVNNKNYNKYGDFNMGEERGPRFWQANGGSSARMSSRGGRFAGNFGDYDGDDEDDYFEGRRPFRRQRFEDDDDDNDMFIPREQPRAYANDFSLGGRNEMRDYARRSQPRGAHFIDRSDEFYPPPASERRPYSNNGPNYRSYNDNRPRYPEERQIANNRVSYSKRKSSCEIDATTKTQRAIPGDGTFVSFPYDESVSTIRLTLWTEDGLPLQAVVDLIQNDSQRVRTIAQVSNDGLQGPFTQLIDVMPNQGGGVLEITNQGPYEFSVNALVEPVQMEIN